MATFPTTSLVRALRAVLPAVSKDQTRPHLTSVWIGKVERPWAEHAGLLPDVIVAVATDGHRLHVATIGRSDEMFPAFTLSRTTVELLLARRHADNAKFLPSKQRVELEDADGACIKYPGQDATDFPDWWQTVSRINLTGISTSAHRYNPSYLVDAYTAAKRYNSTSVETFFGDQFDPHVVTSTLDWEHRNLTPTDERFYALVMPMRR